MKKKVTIISLRQVSVSYEIINRNNARNRLISLTLDFNYSSCAHGVFSKKKTSHGVAVILKYIML